MNLLADETGGMEFRNGVLNVPGDELLACGDRKDTKVLVLRIVSELGKAPPERKLRRLAKRRFKLDNARDRELLEEIGCFCLMCVRSGACKWALIEKGS